jgi:hypothetical protein
MAVIAVCCVLQVNSGGGNYGEFEIDGGLLHFYHGDKKSFDIR